MNFYGILAGLVFFSLSTLFADDGSVPDASRGPVVLGELPTVEALWAGYLDSNGGRRNIEAVQSIQVEGHIRLPGEAPAESSAFRIIRKRPGLLRQHITFPNEVVRQVLVNDRGAWAKVVFSNGEERSQEVSEREQASLRQAVRMESPFLQTEGRPDWLRLRGLETMERPDGGIMEAYRVEVLPKSGLPFAEIWLNTEDFQERKVVMRPAEAIPGALSQTVLYHDYAQVDGVHYARSLHFYNDGQPQQRIEVERLRINVGIFDSYFEEARFMETTKPLEGSLGGK